MEADAHLKTPETPPAEAPVPGYHRRSAHRFEAYAAGPGSLDWDAQPAAFRHYPGCPVVLLPLVDTCLAQAPGGELRGALVRPFVQLGEAAAIAPGLDSLGALLQLALGLTAWKRLGPDRWAVRANPSSGNLHPVEAWVITHGWPGLGDGVHHYRPDDHALELRAADAPAGTTAEPRLFIALSSVMWREAWKYGERAFRYCQLDVGHALGALRYAAAVLGWDLVEQRHIGHATLAARLGLDRFEDYPTRRDPATEREEPELLLAVGIGGEPAPASATALRDACAAASWFGSASTIDRHPMYRWPIVSEVAELTRRGDAIIAMTPAQAPRTGRVEDDGEGVSAAALILHRRSAQRFDAAHVMPLEGLCALLDALDVDARVPFDVLAEQRCIDLLLFIHRLEGMAAGLYLFRRDMRAVLPPALALAFPECCAEPALAGRLLRFRQEAAPQALKRVARSLHCHQDLASSGCLAIGMLAPLDAALDADPAAYRDLHRAAGLLGQCLYLNAEAQGLRGTGIGCFFDEPVGEIAGLAGSGLRPLYHFTIGRALDDPRIETTPAYAGRTTDETYP